MGSVAFGEPLGLLDSNGVGRELEGLVVWRTRLAGHGPDGNSQGLVATPGMMKTPSRRDRDDLVDLGPPD